MTDTEILSNGVVVGQTDRAYDLEGVRYIAFDEILLRGELGPEIHYRGRELLVLHVHQMVGLQVDMRGPRGPLVKGVFCQVVPQPT